MGDRVFHPGRVGSRVCATSPQIHNPFTLDSDKYRCPDLAPLLETSHEFLGYSFKLRIVEPGNLTCVDILFNREKARHDLVLLALLIYYPSGAASWSFAPRASCLLRHVFCAMALQAWMER